MTYFHNILALLKRSRGKTVVINPVGSNDQLGASDITANQKLTFTAEGKGTLQSDEGKARFTGIKGAILGAGNDTVTAKGGAIFVNTGAGKDSITTAEFDDTLSGGRRGRQDQLWRRR